MKSLKALVFLLCLGAFSAASAQTPPVMEVGINWGAPTEYTDGTPIAPGDLSLYTILCGSSAGDLSMSVTVPGTVTSYSRAELLANMGLAFGTPYFCALTATTANGLTSARSATVSFVIQDVRVPSAPVLSVQ